MPRKRAPDYDDKLENIANTAAKLFAVSGYPGVRMSEIAEACDVSKSMLYHYFPAKDDLLFYMINKHLVQVVADVEAVVKAPDDDPAATFDKIIHVFMDRSAQSRQRNLVAMNEAKYLSPDNRDAIRKLERRVVKIVADQLCILKPDLPAELQKPYALFLIGIMNYSDSWYNPKGPIPLADMANRISDLYLNGLSNI